MKKRMAAGLLAVIIALSAFASAPMAAEESEIETESETMEMLYTETEGIPETESETGTLAVAETVPDTDAETEVATGTETEIEAVPETETESGIIAESETETEAEEVFLDAEKPQDMICNAWMNEKTVEMFVSLPGSTLTYTYEVYDGEADRETAAPLKKGTVTAKDLGSGVHHLQIALDEKSFRDRLRIDLTNQEAGSLSAYVMISGAAGSAAAEPIGKTGIRLTWKGTLDPEMTGWKVQLFEQSRMSRPTAAVTVKGSSADFYDLQPEKIYRAVISPCLEVKDAEGKTVRTYDGAKTSLFNLNTKALSTPAAVTELKAAGGECQVKLSWKPAAGATGYNIYYYDGKTQRVTDRIAQTGGTSYTVNALPAGDYSFAVIAYKKTADGSLVDGASSAPASAKVTFAKPEAVKELKASGDDKSVILTWKAAKNAGGYNIYAYDPAAKKVGEKVGATHNLTYTVGNLENGKSYSFVVYGYRIANGYAGLGSMSQVITLKAGFDGKLDTPAWLNVENSKNGNKLTWAGVPKVTGYLIWRYNFNADKYELAATVGKVTSWTDATVKTTKGKFKYKMHAYKDYEGKKYYSSPIEKVIFGSTDMDTVNNKIHAIYYKARINQGTRLYASFDSKNKIGTIRAGERVTVLYRRPGRCKIRRDNGDVVYIKTSALTYTAEIYTSKDYDTADKELFVNYKGYSSPSSYLIWISTYSQHVNIFKGSKGKWKLYRSCLCATGAISTPTPLGGCNLYAKQKAQYYNHTYYRYLSKFKWKNAMHTRVRYYSGRFEDSRLGRPLSHGCVRLHDDNAHYIYDNVPKGTTVIVY